jgi:pilus assembly protein CpaB
MANKKDEVLSRGVVATIYQGEPIMESRLAPTGAGAGLAATIPPGMRAVAVRVNDIVGVAGFVLPGMRVDVLIAGMPPNSTGTNGPQVKTVLQNIEVLSAGQNYQKDAEGKPVTVTVVNLLVDPQQAETLSLASNETRVQLVLRNPLDTQTAKTTGTSVGAIFGAGPPAPPPAAVAARGKALVTPILQIEVFNGAQRSEAQFPQPVGEKK